MKLLQDKAAPPTHVHLLNQSMQQGCSVLEDDTCSNDSDDPERLQIEDRLDDDEDVKSNDVEENGHETSCSKRPKIEIKEELKEEPKEEVDVMPVKKERLSPANSPINRLDTPDSNCSEPADPETATKLWKALAK